MTQDPAKSGGNWYIYGNDNPLRYIDPTGLDADGVSTAAANGVTTIMGGPSFSGITGGNNDNSGDNSNDTIGKGLSTDVPMTFPALMGTLNVTVTFNQNMSNNDKNAVNVSIDPKGKMTITDKDGNQVSFEKNAAVTLAVNFARSHDIALGKSFSVSFSFGGETSAEGIDAVATVTFVNKATNQSIDVAISPSKAITDAFSHAVTSMPAAATAAMGAAFGDAAAAFGF